MPRILAYLVSLGAACILCVYWSDRHDWIKIPIILEIQLGSFEMFISRQPLDAVAPTMIMIISTTIYCILSYNIWIPPIEPTPGVDTLALEFNISSIGDCHLTRGSQVCFGEGMYGWFRTDYDIEQYDIDSVKVMEVISTLRQSTDGNFDISDEDWEECALNMYRIGCGSFHQMCDYSCKPIPMCTNMCHTTLEACGAKVEELLLIYFPVVKSVVASVGIDEQEAELTIQVFLDLLNGCKNLYTNESLCMNIPEMYETNLTGISTEGACTPENAVRYEQYLESLTSESLEAYLYEMEQYNDDFEKITSQKLFFSLGMLIGVSIFEICSFLLPNYRMRLFVDNYVVAIDFLSVSHRLRIFMLALLAGFLCFLLRSIALKLELQGKYVTLTLLSSLLSGFQAVTTLFHQDRFASKYIIRVTQNEKTDIHQKNTTRSDLVVAYIQWYKSNFSIGGKYEYWKYICSEILEVSLQLNVMFTLAKTEDIGTVLANVGIISANLIVNPLLLLHPSPAIWRTLNRFADSCLDSAYLSLLYITLTSRTNANNSESKVIMGILFPVFRLIVRLQSMFRSIICDVIKREIGSDSDEHQDQDFEISKRGPNIISKKIRLTIIVVFFSCGLFLLSSTLYRAVSKSQQCKQEIGEDAWEAIENRVMFPNGILQDTSCNFESVKLLNMSHSSLSEVSASLTKLVNLEVLDLSYNDLTTVPYELSGLSLLTNLNVTGNPVSTRLDWSGLGIEDYPYEFLSFISSLESIDLSNNSISSIGDWEESLLSSVTEFDLSMNKLMMISAEYIVSLNSLIFLNLSQNELQNLDNSIWSMITLKNLDLGYNLFTELSWVWATRQDGFVAEVKGNPVTTIDWSLSISGRTIFVLPEELSDLENLTSFTATSQQIVNLGGLVSLDNLQMLNLSHGLVIPNFDVCNVKAEVFLDFSYSADSELFDRFSCIDDEFVPTAWNISGFPMDFMTNPDSPVLSWIHSERLVANDLLNSSYTNMSMVMSALKELRTLSVRNSPISAIDGALIPRNLTYLDLRNTSMNLEHIQMNLPDFNCTYPTRYICTRTV